MIFWSVKTIKISLKLVFPVCRINFRIQHLTCSLIDHPITIHHDISLKSLLCNFPHHIFYQLLIIYFLTNDLLLLKFLLACHTGRIIRTKVMVSLMASSSSSSVLIQFQRGIINFFAGSNRNVLFIYY